MQHDRRHFLKLSAADDPVGHRDEVRHGAQRSNRWLFGCGGSRNSDLGTAAEGKPHSAAMTTVNVVTLVAAPQTTPRSARRETGLEAYGFCGVAIGSGTFS